VSNDRQQSEAAPILALAARWRWRWRCGGAGAGAGLPPRPPLGVWSRRPPPGCPQLL